MAPGVPAPAPVAPGVPLPDDPVALVWTACAVQVKAGVLVVPLVPFVFCVHSTIRFLAVSMYQVEF